MLKIVIQGHKLDPKSGAYSFPSSLPLPSPPLRSLPLSSPPLSPLPFPLEVGPLIAARGSGGALKLPQRVRAANFFSMRCVRPIDMNNIIIFVSMGRTQRVGVWGS